LIAYILKAVELETSQYVILYMMIDFKALINAGKGVGSRRSEGNVDDLQELVFA